MRPWTRLGVAIWLSATMYGSLLSPAELGEDEAGLSELELYFLNSLPPEENPFSLLPPEMVADWKKKFPYRSLRGRLAYEKKVDRTTPVKLNAQAAERLQDADKRRKGDVSRRAISLALLHGEKTEQFVNSSGFGMSRAPRPGPVYLMQPENSERIPLAKVVPSSADDPSLAVEASFVATAQAAQADPFRMPVDSDVSGFHQDTESAFGWWGSFGYVKSLDQVAGFEPHAVLAMPRAPADAARVSPDKSRLSDLTPDERWKIVRLELVSLLKHETPRVYLSENLPRMDDLSSVKTRAVNTFESAGLETLVAGEDIHTASTPNRIEMLGSLRASKQCLECHQVPHGTLLGAFSYELRRDPPIVVEAPPRPPVQ